MSNETVVVISDESNLIIAEGAQGPAGAITTDFPTGIVIDKASGMAIKLDISNPTYCWKDILGVITPGRTSGPTAPSYAPLFTGGRYKSWFFDTGNMAELEFHLPHDYAPNTDIYIHLHWCHNGTNISGTFGATLGVSYAKGHGQATFSNEITNTISVPNLSMVNTPRYFHRTDEIQLSSIGGSLSTLDTSLLEPDGLILVGIELTTAPTITGGIPNLPAVLFCDIHYQSTNIGTKQKIPNFYV